MLLSNRKRKLSGEQNREKNSYFCYGYAPAPFVVGRSDHEKVGAFQYPNSPPATDVVSIMLLDTEEE